MKEKEDKIVTDLKYPGQEQEGYNINSKRLIDKIEGRLNKDEWKKSKWYTEQNPKKYDFPPSCCGSKTGNYSVYDSCKNKQTFYQTKCATYIESVIRAKAPILIGIACGVAALEIFGIIFACCLCRSIRMEYDA